MPWSSCDVTCGSGTQIRNRICLSPTSDHPLTCQGNKTETKQCKQTDCHGEFLYCDIINTKTSRKTVNLFRPFIIAKQLYNINIHMKYNDAQI